MIRLTTSEYEALEKLINNHTAHAVLIAFQDIALDKAKHAQSHQQKSHWNALAKSLTSPLEISR